MMANVTGVRYILPGMTVFTHVHLNNLIGIASETVYFDRHRPGLLGNIPMAVCTLHLCHLHMSGMGEEDVVWLPRVGNPGNLFFWFHVVRNQLCLILGFTLWF